MNQSLGSYHCTKLRIALYVRARTTQNETFEFKPGTKTTISLLRYVPRFILYLISAFDEQVGQRRSLQHISRLQSHVVLTRFAILPGIVW